jgi:hypothetical protein
MASPRARKSGGFPTAQRSCAGNDNATPEIAGLLPLCDQSQSDSPGFAREFQPPPPDSHHRRTPTAEPAKNAAPRDLWCPASRNAPSPFPPGFPVWAGKVFGALSHKVQGRGVNGNISGRNEPNTLGVCPRDNSAARMVRWRFPSGRRETNFCGGENFSKRGLRIGWCYVTLWHLFHPWNIYPPLFFPLLSRPRPL